jgi:hypothetical protein
VQGAGCRVQGSGCCAGRRVLGTGFGFCVLGSGSGCWVRVLRARFAGTRNAELGTQNSAPRTAPSTQHPAPRTREPGCYLFATISPFMGPSAPSS